MKAYTSLEQSKKLVEILPLESADMYYFLDPTPAGNIYHLVVQQIDFRVKTREPEYDKGDIPAWSLAALLELMPTDDKKDEYYVDTESHSDYHTVSYRNCWDGCIHSEYSKESLLDAAFEMIVWLLKNKKL